MASPCCHWEGNLTVSKILDLLLNSESYTVSTVPPVRPKAGEVYLFSPGDKTKAKGIVFKSYLKLSMAT